MGRPDKRPRSGHGINIKIHIFVKSVNTIGKHGLEASHTVISIISLFYLHTFQKTHNFSNRRHDNRLFRSFSIL
jgi:hypothetical protein